MTSIQATIGSWKSPIQFIGGFTGSTLSSGVTSVTISGHQVGDFLFVVGSSQQTADPSFTAGWTKITSFFSTGTLRVGVMVYKFATTTANETVTFTGTGSSASAYSAAYVFRNVRAIGNSNVVTNIGGSASSIASPSLTLSDTTTGQSALILASYAMTMTAVPNSLTIANGMSYGLLRSSWAGGNFTVSGTNLLNCGIVELLN